MKQLQFILLALLAFLAFSCSDPCDDIDCGPGTCVEGTCDCPPAFSGTNCEILDACFGKDCGPGNCVSGECDCPDGYSGENCETFDPCWNTDCGDYGTCVDGICECDEGYEGESCETEIRAKFVGIWESADMICDGEDTAGIFEIDRDVDNGALAVRFTDPDDRSFWILGMVTGDVAEFPLQDVDLGTSIATVGGTFTIINMNSVTIELDVTALGESYTCSGTGIRQ